MTYGPKYTSLDSLKTFARAQVPPGQTANIGDDAELLAAIARAEDEIDCATGTSFESRTNALEPVSSAWVDKGWLWLRPRFPIVTVTAVNVLDTYAGDTTFTAQSFINPFVSTPLEDGEPIKAGAWTLRLQPQPMLDDCARGRLIVQLSYTSGYQTIPAALQAIADRYAYWFYMIREMPMGRVADLASQTITSPLGNPKDIEAELKGWRRLAS